MDNPFRVGERVSGENFTDRADEVRHIHRAERDPSRLLVYGPRRMGKATGGGTLRTTGQAPLDPAGSCQSTSWSP